MFYTHEVCTQTYKVILSSSKWSEIHKKWYEKATEFYTTTGRSKVELKVRTYTRIEKNEEKKMEEEEKKIEVSYDKRILYVRLSIKTTRLGKKKIWTFEGLSTTMCVHMPVHRQCYHS